jgi:uncharacterized protein (DUF488 family)
MEGAPQDFVALLQQTGIPLIVDVRLRPDRASMGVYVKAKTADKGIQALLARANIAYMSAVELGNLFWAARTGASAIGDCGIMLAIYWPNACGRSHSLCLMCAEQHATECHRQFIAAYLLPGEV